MRGQRDLCLGAGARVVYVEMVLRVDHVRRMRTIASCILARQHTVDLVVHRLISHVHQRNGKEYKYGPCACNTVEGSPYPKITQWKNTMSL